jgi:hypothetical protein
MTGLSAAVAMCGLYYDMWRLLLILAIFVRCEAGVGLLGLGGEKLLLNILTLMSGGGGMIKGSSFSLDTKEPRKTRVHGNGLLIDLDILEIEMGGGILRYSPTHAEFVSFLLELIAS